MEDSGILRLYLERDERAVRETQKKYGKYCLRIAVNILGDPRDAEEAASDALVGAWNAIRTEAPVSLKAFLARLTRRAALKKLRARSAQRRGGGEAEAALSELSECVPDTARTEDAVEARELAEAINAFLDGLNPADRRIFLRRYWYFEPVKDIARSLGVTQSKVKMTLKRRRDELAERLTKEGYIL